MISVDLLKYDHVLMLRCPKCNWRFPVKLPAFCLATKGGHYISCAACGEDYGVHVDLLARAAEQRDEADGELAGKAPNVLSTEDK